jgi:hypothetical protein
MKTKERHWLVKVRFLDQKTGQEKIVTLRAEDALGLTFLQIASLKLQAPIMETVPVTVTHVTIER